MTAPSMSTTAVTPHTPLAATWMALAKSPPDLFTARRYALRLRSTSRLLASASIRFIRLACVGSSTRYALDLPLGGRPIFTTDALCDHARFDCPPERATVVDLGCELSAKAEAKCGPATCWTRRSDVGGERALGSARFRRWRT